MMKPWQTLSNKAPNKGGKQKQREREREREDPSPWQKHKNPQGGHKGAKEQQVMFKSPHRSQEAY